MILAMNRRRIGLGAAAAIGVGMFVLAFVLGPRSCEGGLEMYFWCGIGALVMMLALPFIACMAGTLLASMAWSLAFAATIVVVWVAGLSAANFRIICRLF